jgi:hypothetical protein
MNDNQKKERQKREAYREKIRVIMKVHHEEVITIFVAGQGETKTNPKKEKANPEEKECAAEYREVPKEHVAVEIARVQHKSHMGWN